MVDWFYVALGLVGLLHLLLGCCTFYQIILLISFLAFLRYIYLPADCDIVLWLYERLGQPVESLKGRVVWITGASSGIGEALAVRLAQAGVRIAISARSVENLNKVKQRCIDTGGVQENDVLVLPLDMTQYDQHQAAFDAVIRHYGELDILVSNAGRTQRGRWEMIELDVDRELFNLNVFSLISLARIVSKYFLEKGQGHFAVTSSTAGKLGVPMSAAYTASKHALQHVKKDRIGKRLSAERCAHLFAVSIANKLSEVWIADQPVLTIMYLFQYFPFLISFGLRFLPLSYIMKLRDGRDDAVQISGVQKKQQ
ncbi:dehydrogenase/reductase SDR family member 7 isoform X2 [Cherax quadricarinatus]|uniref:dehydrogenase/reductase SDR family member 7 isoform X2 n=1 Tax=Cherax quadricarinatus TaxID=27406 RepID=UPI002379EA5A|nr:dehydrogenase/reductase SDR family member 7-like isoform X2 [Cherax quadricarinatus]